MKKFFDSPAKVIVASVGMALAVVVAVLIGVSFYYSTHALPGASIAGQSVSGMTREQVAAYVNDQVDGTPVTVDGQVTPTEVMLQDAGVDVDVDQTVDEVFAPNRGVITRVTAMFTSRDIEPVVTVNQSEFDQFCEALESEDARLAANGQVVFDASQQLFVAQPSQVGSEIDAKSLADGLVNAAKTMVFTPVNVRLVEIQPDYDTASAEAAAAQANNWLALQVTMWDRVDDASIPDTAQKAEWVSFAEKDGALVASIDAAAVQTWLDGVVAATNTDPVDGIQNVNSAGVVVSTPDDGSDGYKANNVKALAEAISAAMTAGESYEGRVEYDVTEHSYTQRQIADGAEFLAYPAAPGEKWIDINLSNFTVTAYEGATPVLSSPMVPGGTQTRTVTGEYSVWAKVPSQTMRGKNADGTKYETPDVPWILYFHGGYATHGAYWRSSFGYDAGAGGSHGCVNMPVDQAKALYDWANVGTKVVSHY